VKKHFQNVAKPQNCYGLATRCRNLYFSFVGCRKPKKVQVGNHCLGRWCNSLQ